MLLPLIATVAFQSPAQELAEVERSFSRRFDVVGFKKSFLEFFGAGSISFTPGPGDARKRLEAQPDDTLPDPNIMEWGPVRSDASIGGDYGYTTGPILIKERASGKPIGHGYYMSVWRKEADGKWKVRIDMGTGLRSAWPEGEFKAFGPEAPSKGNAEFPEDAFNKISAAQGEAPALKAFGHSDIRLHRNGNHAYEGLAAVVAFQNRTPAKRTWKVAGSEYAPSRDMGFTYGSHFTDGVEGYFTRVWKLDAKGNWKVVMQVETFPPKPKA